MTNLRQTQLNQQRATAHRTTPHRSRHIHHWHSLTHTHLHTLAHTHSANKYADSTHSFAAGSSVRFTVGQKTDLAEVK